METEADEELHCCQRFRVIKQRQMTVRSFTFCNGQCGQSSNSVISIDVSAPT